MILKIKQMWQKFIDTPTFVFFKKHKKLFIAILNTIIVIILILIWFMMMFQPKNTASSATVNFEIVSGSSTKQIAKKLYEQDLIKSPLAFNLYAKIKGMDVKIKAGNYLISPSMSLKTILNMITSGDILKDEVKITIPEGSTLEKTAEIFEESGLVKKQEFLTKAKVENFKHEFKFLNNIPCEADLEGFLFPDTYFFQRGKLAESYISIMLKRFQSIYFEDVEDNNPMDLNTYEIVTLASIIEAEAKLEEERPIISGVFYNRLKKGMLLQSCATVEYALKEHKDVLYIKDLEVDSPYNTYKHPGLPPGPICMPGLSSIRAAKNPANVEYMYFVAQKHGAHLFSVTYEEHLRNKELIKKTERK